MNLKEMSNKNSKNMFFDVFLGEMLLWFKHNSRDNEKKHVHFMFMKNMRCSYFPKHKNRQPLHMQTSELFIRTNLIYFLICVCVSGSATFLEPQGPHKLCMSFPCIAMKLVTLLNTDLCCHLCDECIQKYYALLLDSVQS